MAPQKVPMQPAYAAAYEASVAQKMLQKHMDIKQVREKYDEEGRKGATGLPPIVEEFKVIEYNGRSVPTYFYRPPGTEKEPIPVVVYYHGGGHTFGSRHSHTQIINHLALQCNVAVVFPEYKLAPEYKFPNAHEDCFATLLYVLEQGSKEHCLDTNKLAVAGDSAGGNLSASMCYWAKERGLPADAIKTQVLIYPSLAPIPFEFPSRDEFGDGDYPNARADFLFYRTSYFGQEQPKLGYPFLQTVEDMKGLPPALVLSAEADFLRDEAEEHARKLVAAGVPTSCFRVLGAGKES
ncbi:lipase [Lichtheimia corymbifera JMRC:FSU:9682]|uniref:Lipase n=1 Tax=Lichtheimia corymbifera JMRC:FSU:9682 TaxID=1263082 RepID=A0A068S5D3_9FUNG|nr:lipase [Lichtheimia corymbifera JMRC:FSU:9682]